MSEKSSPHQPAELRSSVCTYHQSGRQVFDAVIVTQTGAASDVTPAIENRS